MKVKEYLSKMGQCDSITFIRAIARKDEHSPYYHAEYATSPMSRVYELEKSRLNDFIILNDRQPSITWLSGADWNIQISKGWVKCLLIISTEDFEKIYPNAEQREHMEKFIEKQIQEA